MIFEDIIQTLFGEEFLPLQKKSFTDRKVRTDLFVEKLKGADPVDLTSGEEVVIDQVIINEDGYTRENFDDLKEVLPALTRKDNLRFYSGGKEYKISAIAKTFELGGRGRGGLLGPERKVLGVLQKQFEGIKVPITLKIGANTYYGITGVENVRENQKADFVFTGKDPVYISYKPGSSSKDMISYGGITKIFDENETVIRFLEAIKKETVSFRDHGVEYFVPLSLERDQDLILKAMYGKDIGGVPGDNNVQVILQGDNIRLEEQGENTYTLSYSHAMFQSEIPEGTYAPVLNARYASDRNQFGIIHCRVGVIPAGARSNAVNLFT